MRRRRAVALLAAAPWLAAAHERRKSPAEMMDALMWGRERVGGPFTLTDHTGRSRSSTDFAGRLLLVYFGYTMCADVCPSDLHEIVQLLRRLRPGAEKLQTVFITLDPKRDTPQRLTSYLGAFDASIVGLTGTEAQIRKVADAYLVSYRKVPAKGGGYGIDHASFTYLMDQRGEYVGYFPPGTTAGRMFEVLRPHLEGSR
jgi:protein SCO1/2